MGAARLVKNLVLIRILLLVGVRLVEVMLRFGLVRVRFLVIGVVLLVGVRFVWAMRFVDDLVLVRIMLLVGICFIRAMAFGLNLVFIADVSLEAGGRAIARLLRDIFVDRLWDMLVAGAVADTAMDRLMMDRLMDSLVAWLMDLLVDWLLLLGIVALMMNLLRWLMVGGSIIVPLLMVRGLVLSLMDWLVRAVGGSMNRLVCLLGTIASLVHRFILRLMNRLVLLRLMILALSTSLGHCC